MLKEIFLFLITIIIFVLSGCYQPPAPAKIIDIDNVGDLKNPENTALLQELECLTLDDAIRIALANNPNYRSFFSSITTAKMQYYQSLGAYLPSADFRTTVGDHIDRRTGPSSFNPPNNHQMFLSNSIQGSWLLFDGLEREFKMLAAQKLISLETHLQQNAARLLIQTVGIAFCDVNIALAQKEIAERNENFQYEEYRQAQIQFKVGDISKIDFLNFEGRLKQAQMEVIRSTNNCDVTVYILAILMGYPEGNLPTHLKFGSSSIDENESLNAASYYIEAAIRNRPDLKSWRESLKIMEYKLYQSYGPFMPRISAVINYSYSLDRGYNSAGSLVTPGDFFDTDSSFDYGITMNWNLFRGFQNYNRIRELQSSLTNAYYQKSGDFLNMIQQLRTAHSNLIHNLELIKLSREYRDIMLQQRNLAKLEYWSGDVDIIRLDLAQDTYVISENELVLAQINSFKAKLILESTADLLSSQYLPENKK